MDSSAPPTHPRHRTYEDIQALLTGTLFVALGISMFGYTGLLTGGTAGVAFLLHYATGWNFGLLFFAVNVPFYGLAWKRMGKAFTVKTFIAVGLLALLPAVVDAGPVPVVAAGGVADARTAAAALLLGASALQIGSALLRCPEAGIAPVWQQAMARCAPEDTRLTRAFSGRWGRALATPYVQAAAAPEAPEPAPYPVQRGLTTAMRKAAEVAGDLSHLQAWAGQGAGRAQPAPADEWLAALWQGAETLLGGPGDAP
jgi:hypothetical protein